MSKYPGSVENLPIAAPDSAQAKDLMLVLSRLQDNLLLAYRDAAPNIVCAYAYELSCAANRFYHETRILSEPDAQKQRSYLALIHLTRRVLEYCIDLLGFHAPEKM